MDLESDESRDADDPKEKIKFGGEFEDNDTESVKEAKIEKEKHLTKVSCTFCYKIFRTQTLKKLHEKRNHSDKYEKYKCTHCDKSFTNSTALRYHKFSVHKEDNLRCYECKIIFVTYKNYLAHMRKDFLARRHQMRDYEKNPKCKKCGKRICRQDMKRHLRDVHLQAELNPLAVKELARPFKCDNCSGSFKRETHLIQHISDVHIGTEKFQCTKCRKTFKRKHHHDRHILSSHTPFFSSFQCHKCPKKFGRKEKKDRHVKEAHEKEPETFECPVCSKLFSRQENMKRHVQYAHKTPQIFNCPKCGREFHHKSNQTRHTKTCLTKVLPTCKP